jgi:enamine deaminase RidA (YjgF/YER057c/UK114 family)
MSLLTNNTHVLQPTARIGLDMRCVVVISVTLVDLKNLSASPMANLNRLLEVYVASL